VNKIGFVEAVGNTLRGYFRFRGTSTRPEYWWFILFLILISFTTGLLDGLLYPSSSVNIDLVLRGEQAIPAAPFSVFTAFLFLMPTLALTARRFHDAGHSAKWLYLLMIPGGYAILAIVGTGLILFTYGTVGIELLLPIYFLIFPVAVSTFGLGIVYFVFLTKPTKTFFEGNLFAEPNIPDWPYGIEGSTS
jgi:uncharacterized membrane protein YhaH (DUF805 family)